MTRKKLFGTSGIRGDTEKLFTNQFCFDIGRTFAKFLDSYRQDGPIAIGMDPRGSSPRIMKAIQQGLVFAGREVFGQGVSPVPAINYILKVFPAAGSIMVTGSHIASELNGVKFFAFDEEILKEHEAKISQIYHQLKEKKSYRQREIAIEEENRANEEYEEMLVRLGGSFPNWKVVVDSGNGAQSGLMSRVLSRLGLKVLVINDDLQAEFIARDTETEGTLKELQEKVVREKADLGIAYDADGDRVVFVDEKGQFIPGDYSGALIAKHGDTKTVVTPINTSQVVEHLGKSVKRTKVGSPYVVAAMKKTGATFGFEANGGGISSEIMMSRDGGSTTIKVLKLLQEHGESLSSLIGALPRFYLYRTKVECPRELNSTIIKKAKEEFRGKTETADGLKIWLGSNTWILFRPSNNAPEFRVFAEAKTQEKANQLGQAGIKFVQKTIRAHSELGSVNYKSRS